MYPLAYRHMGTYTYAMTHVNIHIFANTEALTHTQALTFTDAQKLTCSLIYTWSFRCRHIHLSTKKITFFATHTHVHMLIDT